MTRLPLVDCNRLHARLTHAACVARYTARARPTGDRWEAPRQDGGAPRYRECVGCPQGAVRAGRPAPRPAAVPSVDVPDTREEAVVALLAGRLTVAQVADAHGVSPTAVRKWLRLAGAARRSRCGSPVHPRRAEADALLTRGMACSAVAARIGVTADTVRRWAQEARAAT